MSVADLVVVGAGPVGLFATYCAGFRELDVVLVDAQDEVGGQVAALYPTKTVHDVAGMPAVSGAGLVHGLHTQALTYSPTIRCGLRVERLEAGAPGEPLTLGLSDGSELGARAVVLTTGVGGIAPRTLPVGHEWHGRGVVYGVGDPADHAGDHVVVVGGGDSALDWAIALAPHAASVTIVHRRRTFRAHAASLTQAAERGVTLLTDAEIEAVHGDERVRGVAVTRTGGARVDLPADLVVGALGLLTAPSPYEAWGIATRNRHIVVDSAMRTSLPGVFAAGDVTTYAGKVALMATGFGEAATAVNNAAVLLDPELDLAPGHSTDPELDPALTAQRRG